MSPGSGDDLGPDPTCDGFPPALEGPGLAELRARFALGEPMAKGGMGIVFRGTIPSTGRACAVKVLSGQLAPELLRRFQREASVLAQVRHPNLVGVLDYGECQGIPWLALELVEGTTLRSLLQGGRRLPADRIRDLAADVGGALEALHKAGIVHRDLKPGNLCIDHQDRTVVIDLGVAVDLGRTRDTAVGMLLGTVAYMAPEVLRGGAVTPETDWYALGVTLHQCLTGRLPWTAEMVVEMAARNRWSGIPALGLPETERDLEEFTLALLDPDPDRRRNRRQKTLPGAEPPGPTPWSKIAPPVRAPPPQDRATWIGRRLMALSILGLLLVAGLAGRAALRAVPDPGVLPADPVETAPSGGAAGRGTQARDPSTRILTAALAEVGANPDLDPRLELERILDDPTRLPLLASRLRAAGAEAASVAGYLDLDSSLTAGRLEDAVGLTRVLDFGAPIGDWWEASRRILAMEARLRWEALHPGREGSAAPEPLDQDPSRIPGPEVSAVWSGMGQAPTPVPAPLVRDLRRTLEELAKVDAPWGEIARFHFWSSLAEWLHGQVAASAPALEYLLSQLRRRLATGEPGSAFEAIWLAEFTLIVFSLTADKACLDAVWSRVVEPALDRVAIDPASETYWRERLTTIRYTSGETEGVRLIADIRFGLKPVSWETRALPLPADWPGSAGTDPTPRIVPDPPEGPIVALPDSAGTAGGLVRAAGLLRFLGGSPETGDRLLDLVESARREDPDPVDDRIKAWPEAVVARAARLTATGDRQAALALLRAADAVLDHEPPRPDLDRQALRGAWVRVREWAMRAELEAGKPERALRILDRHLRTLAARSGPFTRGEVEGAALLLGLAADEIPAARPCRPIQEAARRARLAWLEASPGSLPSAPADRARLWLWFTSVPGSPEGECPPEVRITRHLGIPEAWIPGSSRPLAERLAAVGLGS